MFSGVGHVALQIRKFGIGTIAFDINTSALFDLTHPYVVKVVLQWVSSNRVCGIWLGTPCTTWSVACKPAVRSKTHLYELPDIPAHRIRSVELGNKTLATTTAVITHCIRYHTPCMLERPDSSMLWHTAEIQSLLAHRTAVQQRFCMCSFGTAWRKRTKLAGWGPSLNLFASRMCNSHSHLCQYSGKRHTVLSGRCKVSNRSWTSIAAAYPMHMAESPA